MRWRSLTLASLGFCFGLGVAFAQSNEQDGPVPVQRIPVDKSASRPNDNRKAPPHSNTDEISPDESSSKQNQIDVSPPKGDEKHAGASDEELGEFHAWDPHKAVKCVEVGDYYFKQGNYGAAISRYEEALEWKPRDAEATYKLAQVQEKTGDFGGALENYRAYLKILPSGPYAAKAQQGIERVKPKANTTAQTSPKPS